MKQPKVASTFPVVMALIRSKPTSINSTSSSVAPTVSNIWPTATSPKRVPE